MAEVMAIMNARPLVPVTSDPEMPAVLTPAMLQLFIHSVIFIECVATLMCPSVHMASIAPVHPGRGILLCYSPEGFFPFFPVKGLFGSFS